MKATLLLRRRVIVATDAFADVVVWKVSPVVPSKHTLKYRLAYVVNGACVLRYDNERGKGDHRHTETGEEPYHFSTPEKLIIDFEADIARWNREHGRS